MLEYRVAVGPPKLEKGQIRYCNLDGIAESNSSKALGKRRPCIIFQDIDYNKDDYTVAIIPLSSSPMYASEHDELIKITLDDNVCGTNESYVCLNRMMFIDMRRIGNYVGDAPENLMRFLNKYFTERLGITN